MSRQRCLSRAMAPLALSLALLTSCMTTAVWGGHVHDHDDDGSAEIHGDGGPEWTDNVWTKLLVTPLAIVFDICTFPVQAAIYGWDDDDGDLEEEDC